MKNLHSCTKIIVKFLSTDWIRLFWCAVKQIFTSFFIQSSCRHFTDWIQDTALSLRMLESQQPNQPTNQVKNPPLLSLVHCACSHLRVKNGYGSGSFCQLAVMLEGSAHSFTQHGTNFNNQPGHNCISEIETSQHKIGNTKIWSWQI